MYNILQIIFSGLVTISTVVYAVLTWKLVKETRKIREFQILPDINVRFEVSETDATLVFIIIENMGLGTALDVNFEVEKEFQSYINEYNMVTNNETIKKGLRFFYPKQNLKYFFTCTSKENNINMDDFLIMKVSYMNIIGEKYSKTFELSIKETHGVSRFTPPDTYIGLVAYELNKVRVILGKLEKKLFDKE